MVWSDSWKLLADSVRTKFDEKFPSNFFFFLISRDRSVQLKNGLSELLVHMPWTSKFTATFHSIVE